MADTSSAVLCCECESPLSISADVLIGEIISCAQCGSELEVVGTDPIQIQLAPEVEEDWGE
jgi:alpha-aminoadipate carrier protein LysW